MSILTVKHMLNKLEDISASPEKKIMHLRCAEGFIVNEDYLKLRVFDHGTILHGTEDMYRAYVAAQVAYDSGDMLAYSTNERMWNTALCEFRAKIDALLEAKEGL